MATDESGAACHQRSHKVSTGYIGEQALFIRRLSTKGAAGGCFKYLNNYIYYYFYKVYGRRDSTSIKKIHAPVPIN